MNCRSRIVHSFSRFLLLSKTCGCRQPPSFLFAHNGVRFSTSSPSGFTSKWHNHFWKYSLVGIGSVSSVVLLYKFDIVPFRLFRSAEAAMRVDDGKSNLRNKLNFFADVVEKTLPAVVHIEVTSTHPVGFGFGSQGFNMVQQDGGSGFIVQSDGLILTNAHVVRSGSPDAKITVKLHDGRKFEGRVQMIDRITDLATVKIDGVKNLPVLEFADSNTARPGEFVVAVGSPLFLNNTVTTGVISNAHRKLNEMGIHANSAIEYIQTDAAINVGNSGGPLVNLDCEIIGINTLKVADLDGVSFAIPSNYCKEFLKKAHKPDTGGFFSSFIGGQSKKRREKERIGISFFALTDDVSLELQRRHDVDNLPKHGAMVHSITVGSMAYLAGIEPGDIITHINGQEVITGYEITDTLRKDSENVLEFRLSRDGQPLTIKIEFDA